MWSTIKTGIPWVIALTAMGLGFAYFLSKGSAQVECKKDEMETHIGDTIIISKDTLIVVNYSLWDGSYTLSNGVEVAGNLIE